MNLHRDILRLAVPSILANITVPLVGMVDIAVAGHLGATGGLSAAAFIGGISIGAMLFDMLYWNFGFLRAGTGGLAAQAYGRFHIGEKEAATDIAVTLKRALSIAVVSGLALIALQWVVVQVAFLLVDCTPEVQNLATQYFYIRIWAAPATLSLFAFKGWFIGMQDTVRPMICDLLVNAVNIVLSIGLAFGYAGLPELGFKGVAAISDIQGRSREEVIDICLEKAWNFYEARIENKREAMIRLEKQIALHMFDRAWSNHIDTMDKLRSGIGLRSYAQHNPLQAYVQEGFELFQEMMRTISQDIVTYCMNVSAPAAEDAQ